MRPAVLYMLFWSLMHSWSNFGRSASPGKIHCCSKFSPIVYNGSHCGSLEPKSLGNGFVTHSRLIDISDFCFLVVSLDCDMMHCLLSL